MILILAGLAVSVSLSTTVPGIAWFPFGAAIGGVWGGPLTAVAFGLFASGIPLSYRQARKNARSRELEGRLMRALEAMVEASYVSTRPDEILAAGGQPIEAALGPEGAAPVWLRSALAQVLGGARVEGASLNRPLLLLLQEAQARAQLAGEWRSQNGALWVVAGTFLFVEATLAVAVLLSPQATALFRTGAGPALTFWVVLTTALALALPWLRSEALLW